MNNLRKIKNWPVILVVSVIVAFGTVWSCDDKDVYNPGIQAPVITSIESDSAFVSQEVIIYGANFSSFLTGNTVGFNGVNAEIVNTTTLALTVIVPDGIVQGDASVTVTTNDLTSESFPFYVTMPIIPVITSVEPDNGKVGTTVIITGTDFSTTPADNIVTFGGVEAVVTEATATTLTVTVPAGAVTGDVMVMRDAASNGVLFTVTLSSSVIRQIAEDADDAEEGAINGKLTVTSSDLELGEYDTWTQDEIEQGLQMIGLKFTDITIPPGSVILAASIQFTCDNTGSDPVQLTIYGETSANPESYSEDIFYHISSRSRTTANVVWDIPPWEKEGDAGAAQLTPDLGALVKEIIALDDWTSGSNMAFIMEHSGPSIGVTSSSGGREADANPDSGGAAILTIIYD
jgi:hypothetical protein